MSKKKPQKKTYNVTWIFSAILAAEVITGLLLILALAKLNLLQTWQLVIVTIVLCGLFVLNLYKLLFSHKSGRLAKTICLVLAIILTIASAFGFKYIQRANNFIDDITGKKYEQQTYEVRTLKKSGLDSIDKLSNQKIGFLSTNPNLDATKTTLSERLDYEAENYAEIGTMLLDIYDNKIPAVVINQSYLDFLAETDFTFEEDSQVVYTFEITVEQLDIHKNTSMTDPFIIYISGSDSLGPITQVARSDVNIVAVVNPKQGKILLVNIPRDYYVQLHGTVGLKDKLTHAGIYGINMSKTTINDLLGIEIDHTVKVGFSTVINVVDAIDGIDIYSDTAFRAVQDGTVCNFKKGNQYVNAKCALAFARTRKAYASGDRHRGQNQQQVLTKIIEKITTPKYLARYPQILDAAKGSFETSLTADQISAFGRFQLAELTRWKVESIALDGEGAMLPTYSMGPSDPRWVMIPDESTVDTAKKRIAEYLK